MTERNHDNMLPKVSVIIPTYNDNERLELCLKLLTLQSYPAELTEIIVVDNGSDVLPSFVGDIYPGAKLLVEYKKGSYAARNAGLKIASGEVMAFTDSDCQPTQDWLTNGVSALLQANKDIVAGGPLEFIFHDPSKPNTCELMESIFDFKQYAYITVSHYTVTANLFTWRRVFDDVGFFNGILASGGDYEWGRRAYSAGYEIVYDNNIIINHPSRHEFREVIKKRKRIVLGLCEIAKKNKKDKLTMLIKLLKLFPSIRYRILPVLKTSNFSLTEKLKVCMLVSILHFYEYWHRLLHAHYLLYLPTKKSIDCV